MKKDETYNRVNISLSVAEVRAIDEIRAEKQKESIRCISRPDIIKDAIAYFVQKNN